MRDTPLRCLLLLFLLVVGAAAADDVLCNGGFEDADMQGRPAGWMRNDEFAANGTWDTLPEAAAEGRLGLVMTLDDTNPTPKMFQVLQVAPVERVRGRKIRLSARVQPADLQGQVAIGVWGGSDALTCMTRAVGGQGGGWRELSVTWDVPQEVTSAAVFLLASGAGGKVFVDEVRLEVTGAETPAAAPLPPLTGSLGGVRFVKTTQGRGALCDRPGAIVALPIESAFPPPEGTIEIWLRCSSDIGTEPDGTLLALHPRPYYSNLQNSVYLLLSRQGWLLLVVATREDWILTSARLDWKKGQDHHVAITWGPRGWTLWVDGQAEARKEGIPPPSSATGESVYVGNSPHDRSSPCPVILDHLRISRVARTGQELAQNARARKIAEPDRDVLLEEDFLGAPRPPLAPILDDVLGRFDPGCDIHLPVRIPWPPDTVVPEDLQLRAELEDLDAEGERRIGASVGRLREDPEGERNRAELNLGRLPEGVWQGTLELAAASGEVFGRGRFAILVAPPVENLPAPDEAFLGLAVSRAHEVDDLFFRRLQALGIRWLRLPMDWREVQPAIDRWDWKEADRRFQAAARAEVRLVPTLAWNESLPAWAEERIREKDSGWDRKRFPPSDTRWWIDYVAAAAKRFRGRAWGWSLWNEPNREEYWQPHPDPRAFADLARATADAVRKADPKTKVLGPDLYVWDSGYMKSLFEYDAGGAFDIVTLHPFHWPQDPDRASETLVARAPEAKGWPYRRVLEAARTFLAERKCAAPIWITEVGQPIGDDVYWPGVTVPPADAARYFWKYVLESRAAGIERLFWFTLQGNNGHGLLTEDGYPTPQMAAFHAYQRLVAGAAYEGRPSDAPEGLQVHRLRRPDHLITVLWSPSGEKGISVEGAPEVFDHFGRRRFSVPGDASASRRLTVGPDPILLIGPCRIR